MPLANLPMTLAVHGATSSSAIAVGNRDVLDVGVHPRLPLRRDHRTPRDRLERHRADEPRRRPRHHGDDVVPALLQPAAHLDRLVGADAAGHAEGDQGHVNPNPIPTPKLPHYLGLGRWELRRLVLDLLDLAPQHFALRDGDLLLARLARQRAAPAAAGRACPAMTTNSNRFSLGALSMAVLCPLNVSMIFSAARPHRFTRARSASTIARSRSTAASTSSLTTTYSYSANSPTSRQRHLEPPADLLFAVLAAAAQPLLEDRRRRRQHEDADGLDAAAAHLPRALHVDDQHHVLAARPAAPRCRRQRCRSSCRRRRPTRGTPRRATIASKRSRLMKL